MESVRRKSKGLEQLGLHCARTLSMAWRLNKAALKCIRESRGFSFAAVAELTGLDRGTLHRHESPSGPRSVHYETAQLLARVYECSPGDFARWASDDEPDAQATLGDEQSQPRVRAVGRLRKMTVPVGRATPLVETPLVLHTGSGTFDLVGATRLYRLFLASRVHVGDRLAVHGMITETEALSPMTAEQLGAPLAVGVRCLVQRETERQQLVGVTVLTREALHTRHLLDAWEGAALVTAIVQVVVSPDDGSHPGFRAAPEARGKRLPFALVVESIPETASIRCEPKKDSLSASV